MRRRLQHRRALFSMNVLMHFGGMNDLGVLLLVAVCSAMK
jgi:hypothetical protein